jgi:predicted HTH transcriptional regulator
MMLSDSDILARLAAIEDSTVERKTFSDNRDWIKTAVAFSNSLAVGQPGVLFVGVYNDGNIQDQAVNFEEMQKKVSGELSNIYPPIYPTIVVREKEGKRFIAVIIYGSTERPHFAGRSFVRDGTRTIDASEESFRKFIAQRSGKVAEILRWRNKEVVVNQLHPEEAHYRVGRIASSSVAILHDCNEHWVTLRDSANPPQLSSTSLRRVELNYDDGKGRLVLEIYPS